jgi:hypothetical protein
MNSVELYAEARMLKNVCKARMDYLRKQAMSFYVWLGTQAWCADPTRFCEAIVERVELALDPDADKFCEYLFEDKTLTAADLNCFEMKMYNEELEAIADRGYRKAFSKAERLRVLELRLENYKEELQLHDKIQDFLDLLPKYKKEGQYIHVFKRLDALKNQGRLSYSGWIMFSNQLMEKMGRPAHTPNWEVKYLADQMSSVEKKIAELNQEILFGEEYFNDNEVVADHEYEQLISQA